MDRNYWTFTAIVASALILAGKVTIAQTAADEDLITLAHEQFKQFSSDVESQAFEAFFQKTQDAQKTQDGKSVDLKEQTIKAEWLRWLCNDAKASAKISSSGINVAHAKIVGKLYLAWAKMQFPLQTSSCIFTDSIILDWANLPGLKLEKANILGLDDKAFSGVGLTVDGDVDFSDFNAQKPVSLRNAKIGGHFNAPCAHFGHDLISNKVALDLSKAKIGSDVKLASAVFHGKVLLAGAEIGGDLDFRDAKIQSNGLEKAVDAASARIDDSVLLSRSFYADGELSFFAANIGRDFDLDCSEPLKEATLDLRDAKARILKNGEKSWPQPGNLELRGFTFNELGDSDGFNAQTQVEWLRLQPKQAKISKVQTQIEWLRSPPRYLFIAQPYEQMATVFRNMGLEEEGVKVNIAENQDARWVTIRNDFRAIVAHSMAIGRDGVMWRYGKVFIDQWEWLQAMIELFYDILWYCIFGPLIGYGYRPWNALFISLGFIWVGTSIFRFAAANGVLVQKDNRDPRQQLPEPDHREPDRNFSAFIYSLETFVPLVKLGVAEYWIPTANLGDEVRFGNVTMRRLGVLVLWYFRIHIMAGWVFTSLWVAAFAGILKH